MILKFLYPAFVRLCVAGVLIVQRLFASETEVSIKDTIPILELREKTIINNTSSDRYAVKDKIKISDEERLHLTIDQMLLKTPGISTISTGGIGSYMGVSLWGSSSNQVNIYINGIPQNQASSGAAFLSDIDPAQIEEIEVYKGMSPDFLEGSPIGGAINIITKRGQKGAALNADAGIGSYGLKKGNAGVQAGTKSLNTFLHSGWDQGDNNYDYLWDQRMSHLGERWKSQDDLVTKTLSHNQHKLFSVHSATSWYPGKGNSLVLDMGYSNLDKNYPVPELDSNLDQGPWRRSGKFNGQIIYQNLSPESRNLLSSRIYINGVIDEYNDESGLKGLGKDWDRDSYYSLGAAVRDRYRFNNKFKISSQVSYSVNSHQYKNLISRRTEPEIYRFTGEGKISPTLSLNKRHQIRSQVSFNGNLDEYYRGVRYSAFHDTISKKTYNWLWNVYGEYRYILTKNAETFFSAGNGYRMPTFYERFGDRGTVKGNPKLEPEESVNISSGFVYSIPHFTLTTRIFHRTGTNTITASMNSQNVVVYENTDRTEVNGEELSLRLHKAGLYQTVLNLTHQTPMNRSKIPGEKFRENKLIPFQPIVLLHLSQDFFWNKIHFNYNSKIQGLTLSNPSNYSNFYDPYSGDNAYQIRHNCRLGYAVWKLQTTFSVNNITDENLFDIFGSPLPGRTFLATIQYKLK